MKLALFTMVTGALAYSNLLAGLSSSKTYTIDNGGLIKDCSLATDMDMDSFCEVANQNQPPLATDDLWMIFILPAPKNVRSIFVLLKEDSGIENDEYFFEVGASAKTKNPLACNTQAITQSGWYKCDNVLNGAYISVYNTGKAMLHFREIMLFEEYFIQPYIWYTWYTPLVNPYYDPFKAGGSFLYDELRENAYTTLVTTGSLNYLYSLLKGSVKLKSLVVIPNKLTTPEMYITVMTGFGAYPRSDYVTSTFTGQLEFPIQDTSLFYGSLAALPLPDHNKIEMSITSIGLLSDCDCLTTGFGQSFVYNTGPHDARESNPTSKSVSVTINGGSQTVYASAADSVGVTCSADEQFCGPRTFQVLDATTGVAETALITFVQDHTTQIITMTIAATTGMPVGTRKFNLMVTLTNYPISQAVYSEFTVTVTADPCYSTIIDPLATITDITVNMPVATWPYISLTTPGNSESMLNSTRCGLYQLYVNSVPTPFTSNDVILVVTQAVGTYPQVIELGLIDYPTVARSKATFNIIVTDLCASTTLNSFEASPQTVSVTQLSTSQAVTVIIPTNTVTEANPSIMCGPLILTVNGTAQTLDASSMFTVTYALETTTYTTELSFLLQNYPDIPPVSYSLVQDVTYTDLCLTTAFTTLIAIVPTGPLSVPLPPTSQSFVFAYGSDEVSDKLSKPDYCGPRFFQINGVETSYDASYQFSILTSATKGTQTYEITMGLVNYPLVPVMSQSVVITVIDPCDTTIIDALAVQPDVTITFPLPGQTIITVLAPSNSASTAQGNFSFCGPLILYVNNVIQELDASNQFTIVPGRGEATYTYVLSYGLENYPLVTKATTSFLVTVTDPCEHSILSNFEQAATYEILIGESVSIDIFVEPTDLESLNNGNNDGYTFCGSRQLVLTDGLGIPIDYYTYASNKLTITPLSEGDAAITLYWQLLDYPAVKSQKVIIAIKVTKLIEASIPYFSNGSPSFQYTMLPNSNLDLSFVLLKDNGGDFTITAQLNQAAFFGQYTATEQNGVGSLSFTFQSTSLLSTTTITITVAEVYDAELCPTPTSRDYSFILKVEASQNTTTTKSNTTSTYVPPVVLTKNSTNSSSNAKWASEIKSKLVIGIQSISRLAVVKVAYNQLLEPEFATMIVGFTQTSFLEPINMNWTFVSSAPYEFYIQCTFDRPLSVSAGQQPDKLYVYFYDPKTDRQYKLQALMPLLIGSADELKMLSGISDTMGGTAKYIFYIYLVCNVLFSFALGMLWGTFQTLQFIIDFPFLLLKVPLNVLLVFQGFEDIVNMKIVNTTQVYEWTMSKVARQPQHRLLQDTNSTSNTTEPTTAPDNLTSELFMAGIALIIVLLIIAMIVACIKCYYQKLPQIMKSLVMTIKHKLMWNSILRYMSQSYLGTTITCMRNLLAYHTLTLTSKILTPFIVVYAFSTPLIFYKILQRKKDLHSKDAKQSIGTLYMNQDTYKKSVVHYAAVFIARRLIFAMTIAFIPNVVAQLYVTIMCSLMTLCYLCVWQPMENRVQNGLALFNEAVLMTCCYLMFLFTDYVPTPELHYYFGNYLLYVLYLDFGLNFILLAREIILIIRRNCTRIIMHRRWRRQIRERIQKRKERKEWYDQIKKFRQTSFLHQTQNVSQYQITPGVQKKLIVDQPNNVKYSTSSLSHKSEKAEQQEQQNVLSFISLDESLQSYKHEQKSLPQQPLLSFISLNQSNQSVNEQDQRRIVQQSQRLYFVQSRITSELHSSMPSLRSNQPSSQMSQSIQSSSEQQSSEQLSSSQSQILQTSSYGSSQYSSSHLTSQQPSSRQHIASSQPSEITSIELSSSEAGLSEMLKSQSNSSIVHKLASYQPSDLSSISLSSQSHQYSLETPLQILSSNPSSNQASGTSSELGSNYRKYTPHPVRLNRRKIIE